MKKGLLFALLVLIGLTSATILKPQAFKVDVEKSTFRWEGKKVTGSHWGYMKFSSGTVNVDKGVVVSGSFDVDMNSMDCQDIKGDYANKLLGHLKSDDFFSVDKHPITTLKLKSLTPITNSGENNFNVKADLTIKGITQEVSFPAAISVTKTGVTAKADFNINRTKFDIKYRSGSFVENLGDKLIYDDFNVKVNLVASKATM